LHVRDALKKLATTKDSYDVTYVLQIDDR